MSFPGDQMDTMEDSEVVVILKGLHPSGLPGQPGHSGDIPPKDWSWSSWVDTQDLHCMHPIMAWCQWPSMGSPKNPSGCVWKKTAHETCAPAEHSSLDLFSAPANSGGARDAG